MGDDCAIECTVGDIAAPSRNALVGGPFGSDLVSRDYVPGGVPVIRGANMGHGRWVDGEFAYVTPDKADALAANCAKRGDLVFTQRGTLGQVALVPKNGADRYLISQSQMKLTVDAEKADAMFLYYLFTSAGQQAYIRQNAIQTGVPHTNLGILRNTPLTLPSLPKQKAIAHILGSLDDKIEINRGMNQTLETTAQALFKYSFVAPTKDGPPRGWRVAKVGETCEMIFSGGTPSTKVPQYWGGTLPWLSSGETRNRFITETQKTITDTGVANSSTRLARAGCTVIAGAGQGHTRGQTSLLTFDSYINQSVVALAADSKVSSDLFLFFDLARRYEEFRQLSDSHSSRGSLTTKLLAGVNTLLPPRSAISQFDSIVGPIVAKVTANLRESRTLAQLRDTLLPKLLSGELRVPVAEACTEVRLNA